MDSPGREGRRNQSVRLRERQDVSEALRAESERRSRRNEDEMRRLTWSVALPLDFGTEGDGTRGAEPAAQGLLLCAGLGGL